MINKMFSSVLGLAIGSAVMAVPVQAAEVVPAQLETVVSEYSVLAGADMFGLSQITLRMSDGDWDDDDDDDRWKKRRRYQDRYYGRKDQRDHYYDDRRYDERVSRNTRVWRDRDGRIRCRRNDGTTGLIVGGALGALLGREVDSRGDRSIGTILGAAGGALLGRELERGRCR